MKCPHCGKEIEGAVESQAYKEKELIKQFVGLCFKGGGRVEERKNVVRELARIDPNAVRNETLMVRKQQNSSDANTTETKEG